MGKEPPPIIDAEFEVVTPPTVEWQPVRLRYPWWVIPARVFCGLVLAYAALDIVSNGKPIALLGRWLTGG